MDRSPHEIGREVVGRERDALSDLFERMPGLADAFDEAVKLMLECSGRVVFCGMGKSGLIGEKIARTMVSTGTLASTLHPAEGFHGDVGLVTSRDVVVAISNSGTTRELLELVPVMKNLGAKVIAMTGPTESPLTLLADVVLPWGAIEEADATGLVPTVSAAVTLALGDALTVAVMERRGFGADQYAIFHPSGAIGNKLTLKVMDLIRGPHSNPCVTSDATFGEALAVITRHVLGGVNVVDDAGRLVGILTDGDVRRLMQGATGTVADLNATPVGRLMSADPTATRANALAIEALRQMEDHVPRPINVLPVVDADGRAVGLLHVHTLVQAGLTSED
jgi:arabinose-5-phosphate isomerase